jgi:hypothetical protein
MQDWEIMVTPCMEQITWEWHLMYHVFWNVSLLQSVLPPFPWTHNKDKARTIRVVVYIVTWKKQNKYGKHQGKY